MWNTKAPARLVTTLAMSLLALAAATPSARADSFQVQCRKAIGKGLATWLSQTLNAQLACQSGVMSGALPANTNCVTGAGDLDVRRQLLYYTGALHTRLAAGCSGAHWGLLSYPGPCPDDAPPFNSDKLAECIADIGTTAISSLFATWYPPNLDGTPSSARDCVERIPDRASSMILKEARLRLRCLLDDERAATPSGIDCRAQLPPYGPGTGDERLDAKIAKAEEAWFTSLPTVCATTDLAALGYGTNCPDPAGSGAGLVDLQACVFGANRLKIPLLLDLAFPSAPVCGNEIVQEGEQCDNGVANSNTTPDACRLDCTLPVCGDGVTDPKSGETCDDGNTADLDGCNATCGLEFCGDGIVNNLPNEDCDDHNSNPHDACTNDCKAAVCGDGVVCNDPSCTSGPGGGPEQCDQGANNSATGICKPDCSGYTSVCTLTVGVTNTVKLGALTYELSYDQASGEMVGSGGKVQCTSTVTGGLQSFFDNDASRFMKESLIVDAGLQAPAAVAHCTYATNDQGLGGNDFTFTIDAASDPNFQPVTATMAVISVVCQ